MAQTTEQTLLDPQLMAKLEQLELLTRKIFRGSMKGERRSKRRGESVEFADYRNYVPGDDLRFLDWNVYARLDKLFLKLFLEEEDLHVSVLFDVSKSMDWGKPVTKGLYAKRVAASPLCEAMTFIMDLVGRQALNDNGDYVVLRQCGKDRS